MLRRKTTVIDLNWLLSYSGILLSHIRRATAHEQRTNSVFADSRLYSKAPIQSVCQSLQGKLSSQIVLLFRPIPNDGFCPTDLSGKFKRHRNLLKSLASKTLSLWFSWERFPQQFSQCKRKKRLANLSRLCTGSHQKSTATLRRRRFRYYTRKYRLCFGCHGDRFMPVIVPLGSTSQTQKCCKAPYADGLERLHTHVYTHYKRCCTRNNSLSNDTAGSICYIRHGQRLHGFCNIIQFFKEQLLLHNQSKKECRLLSQVFSYDRQENRLKKRPDNKTDGSKNFNTLPDTTEANHFSRRRTVSNFRVSDQQLSVGRIGHLSALQAPLADRTVLQVDQTAPTNKVILWYFDQRSQDAGVDRDQYLCARSDCQKGNEIGAFVARNTPNYKHHTFRENPSKTSTYGKSLCF